VALKNNPRTRLFLLGPFQLEINSQTVNLPTRKAEGLLAYLVLHPAVQNRERMASLFWGDSPDELARRSLRTALSSLRKELGEEFITADRETIQLNPDYPLWVDIHEMEEQAKNVLSGPHASIDPELYRGDLLQDFYDDWVLEEREHYRGLFINAMLQSAQSQRTNGEYRHAIFIAQKIISIDSVNEHAWQHLIFCYGALSNRSEAMKSYEECARRLMEQLGVEPSEDTVALYEQVKRSNVGGTTTSFTKSNLPIPLTSFIGRESEIETLKEIFDKTRLLTLTGVGGCGKTRLSIQLAAQIADQFPDGVWWFELAAIQNESVLLSTIEKTLGLSDSRVGSAEEAISSFLHTRNALLILDNCEHLITACARFAEIILRQCPSVKILATSREALSIHGEIAWLVPSLSLPPIDQTADLLQWECPRLFFERAAAYRPDLKLTEDNAHSLIRICRALEGIPLAIELAAARVKTLSLEQLASRLDDKLTLLTTGSRAAQPRQQTLRAAIDWSYELLPEPEQIVLQRLSIFAGTWTLAAAEAICADENIQPAQILDLVTHLLDKSLLVTESQDHEIRYKLLEIIRQYAFEKLEQRHETEKIRDGHTQYYLQLAQAARPFWFTPEHARLIKQFDADYPNLRVALAWGLENPNRSTNWKHGMKLAVDMGPLWNFLAEYNEGQMWLKKVIDQINVALAESGLGSTERSELLSIKAKALYECGFIIWFQSHYAESRAIFLESAELFAELNDASGLAYSNMFLAHPTWLLGQQTEARRMWAQSLEQFNQTGDLWGAGMVHSFIGRAERESGNYEQAELEYGACVELFSKVGDGWGLGISLSHLGMLAFQQDNPQKAQKLFEQRLNLSRENGFRQSLMYSIFLLGVAAWKLGDRVQVQTRMREALPYAYEIGNYVMFTDCLVGLAWAETEMQNYDQAAYLLGVIETADKTYQIKSTFEDVYFRRPVLADLLSRVETVKYVDALEKGRTSTLDQVAKEILKNI
jgi:non-specific serine/threonine protein kinase